MEWKNVEKIAFTRGILEKIYAILVNYVGASERESDRDSFVFSHLRDKYPCNEYRFCGNLNFGGKFRNDPCVPVDNGKQVRGQWFVTCYLEDETIGRRKLIEATNNALMKLEDECRGCNV